MRRRLLLNEPTNVSSVDLKKRCGSCSMSANAAVCRLFLGQAVRGFG